MDTANQQRILGYFIEEAKEHLQTLEQGILQLATSVKDTETVNEMFRAAHSVKGGAAMLGYTSIQKTAHRLEDSFKILKDNPVDVDQKLETLFLNGYDHLQDLIERLENSADFNDGDAIEILQQAESNFAILDQYLQQLLSGGSGQVNLSGQVTTILKQMLQIFKQPDSPESRQKLHICCRHLRQIAPEEANWQQLLTTTQKAITNKKYPYGTIAQVVIKEIKQAGDYLNAGQAQKLVPSKNLQQLAATAGGPAGGTYSGTVSIPRDPQGAALALMKTFNKQQITQIFQIIKSRI
ncbi:MAG TPA: Hpt domain-containing protein [Coleofasciculaceae cyanobacterium]